MSIIITAKELLEKELRDNRLQLEALGKLKRKEFEEKLAKQRARKQKEYIWDVQLFNMIGNEACMTVHEFDAKYNALTNETAKL